MATTVETEALRKADHTFVRVWWLTMTVIAVAVMVFAVTRGFQATMVEEGFVLSRAIDLVGVLFFVTLLQERALEVLISTVRGTKASARKVIIAKLEVDIANYQEARDGQDKLRQWTENLHNEKVRRDEFRSGTIILAFSASMALGILISAVGIRVLAQMFQVPPSGAQQGWFTFTDVLITGALIAGGSEGMHKITTVLSNFLESQAEIAKKKAG